MKQYHVYGIGNALVDIDFEVSDSTLQRLNIDKGLMTLIDEDRHHLLLEELDGVKHLKACGGSAANTLFTMQQLGARTFYSCKVGNDDAGKFFYENLISTGMHTNLNEQGLDGITGKCIVLVTPDADRTLNTFLGTTSRFSRAQLSEHALKNSHYLYIEGYLAATDLGKDAASLAHQMAKKHNIKTALSLSDPNMVTYFKDALVEIIHDQVDILFCNEKEAKLFTGCDSIEDIESKLRQYAKTFVITLGEKGSIVFDGKKSWKMKAYPVEVVDTVGAGDIFAGAFLYAITHNYDYASAGKLASHAASKVIAKFGPRLTVEEIREILGTASFTA